MESGGNPWRSGPKLDNQGAFRDSFSTELNKRKGYLNDDNTLIDGTPMRPIGTPFNTTSFAYIHKNALFITVDVFYDTGSNYFDRNSSKGGEGQVTCTVSGEHLKWFESVLIAARKDETIKHIFVQAHVPIIQPVRKMSCSGQFFDGANESEFWKLMQLYNVDVYFCGEVHANTATKDPESNLIQVVSRGNRIQKFLKIKVRKEIFTILAYNEIGPKSKWNGKYVQYGKLKVDKSGLETTIKSSGVLELVDIQKGPLLRYRFEKNDSHSLLSKQIIGMKYNERNETLVGESMTIRGTNCTQGLNNYGVFGRKFEMVLSLAYFLTSLNTFLHVFFLL